MLLFRSARWRVAVLNVSPNPALPNNGSSPNPALPNNGSFMTAPV